MNGPRRVIALTVATAWLALPVCLSVTACGRYGPPVRPKPDRPARGGDEADGDARSTQKRYEEVPQEVPQKEGRAA